MGINLPEIGANNQLSKIAINAGVSERILRRAAKLMSAIKEDPVSIGKDLGALSVAVLYGACLEQEEIRQTYLEKDIGISSIFSPSQLVAFPGVVQPT